VASCLGVRPSTFHNVEDAPDGYVIRPSGTAEQLERKIIDEKTR
jgi:hypothetical protein